MKEIYGDLWEVPFDLRVITTNGFVKKDGSAVMGRGCAWEAKTLFPGIEYKLGKYLAEHGNHCHRITPALAALPVKHNWWAPADPVLIERSIQELVALVDRCSFTRVVLPRPGCGNGLLSWEKVKPLIEPYLDDRFNIITWEEGANDEVG